MFDAKPLPKLILRYCQLNPSGTKFNQHWIKLRKFNLDKCIWKCCQLMPAIFYREQRLKPCILVKTYFQLFCHCHTIPILICSSLSSNKNVTDNRTTDSDYYNRTHVINVFHYVNPGAYFTRTWIYLGQTPIMRSAHTLHMLSWPL